MNLEKIKSTMILKTIKTITKMLLTNKIVSNF